MNSFKFAILIIILSCRVLIAQEPDNLTKSTEEIVRLKDDINIIKGENEISPIGIVKQDLLFKYEEYNNGLIRFYRFNEEENKFQEGFSDVNLSGKRRNFFNNYGAMIFYSEHNYSENDNGYSNLNLYFDNEVFELGSIINADKRIHSSFSTDGKILIVNTLNTLAYLYSSEQDDNFWIYNLENIDKGEIKKDSIPCLYCAKGYLIGDNLFYTKSLKRDDYTSGYSWTNIYINKWGENLDSSQLIALNADILAVSPDGRYILGTRRLDIPNDPVVIIDVETKKYQLILGREYSREVAIYSVKKQKFAFHFDNHIIYIDFPKEYPFDALSERGNIPKWNRQFYKQFEHEPLR